MWFTRHNPQLGVSRDKALILVVDDDVQVVTMLRSNLESEGYHVEGATDGITGKQKAWSLKPDLIIADIIMPGVDGIMMMQNINNEYPELSNVPIIFLSAAAEGNILPKPEGNQRRYALMKKPVFLPELNILVRQFIEG